MYTHAKTNSLAQMLGRLTKDLHIRCQHVLSMALRAVYTLSPPSCFKSIE